LEQQEYDNEIFGIVGLKVIRFWNNDVMKDIDGVILAILHIMEDGKSKD